MTGSAISSSSASSAISDQTPHLPNEQQNLIDIWNTYDTKFNNAPNSIVAGEINTAFNQAYCEAVPTGHVSNWIGVIKVIHADADTGGIILVVDIDPNSDAVSFRFNLDNITKLDSPVTPTGTLFYLDNDSTDIGTQNSYIITDPTLIAQNAPLYNSAVQLEVGDLVEFSGDFIPRKPRPFPFDCEGGIGEDDLSLFQFDAIYKVGTSSQ